MIHGERSHPSPGRALVDAALLPGVSVGLATLLPLMAQQWGRSQEGPGPNATLVGLAGLL